MLDRINGDNGILLIEDNASDRDLTRLAWDEAGYAVQFEEAVDFRSALRKLEEIGMNVAKEPSLILLDLNLPGGNGKDLLRLVRASSRLRAIPVVVLTTSSDPNDRLECLKAGADAYEVKPSGFGELIDCMHRVHELMSKRIAAGSSPLTR